MMPSKLHENVVRAGERSRELGSIGKALLRILLSAKLEVDTFARCTLVEKMVFIDRVARGDATAAVYRMFGPPPDTASSVARSDLLFPMCLSMLLCDFPVQIGGSDNVVAGVLRQSFPQRFSTSVKASLRANMTGGSRSGYRRWRDASFCESRFPYKPIAAAPLKQNVRLAPLARDLMDSGSERFLAILGVLEAFSKEGEDREKLSGGQVYADQAVSVLLYAFGLSAVLPFDLAAVAAVGTVVRSADTKGLSTCLKSTGLNASQLGAMLTEGQVLQGRGVGSLDLEVAAEERCSIEWVGEQVVDVDQSALRRVVQQILEEELAGQEVRYADLDDFWSARWSWCVNGAHNRGRDADVGLDLKEAFPGCDRFYRRMFSEAMRANPIPDWDGQVKVSPSAKLEHGKTRAIFACDTLSYFAFEHFLGPVARAWQHKKVILDPGRFGHLGMVEKIRKARGLGGTSIMLDYDDFNSQHSTASMKTVIEETARITGYPGVLAQKLVESFESIHIGKGKGGESSRVKGTLMSGHRGTTYINSVLNAAYVRLAVGDLYRRSTPFHVGDDIFMAVPDFESAGQVLQRMRGLGCRMNPLKQSVGVKSAEFLRVASNHTGAWGYLPRSIASVVSGNWTSDMVLGAPETLKTMIAACHTLSVRGGDRDYARLLLTSVARTTRLPRSAVLPLLRRECGIGTSPVFSEGDDLAVRAVREVAGTYDKQGRFREVADDETGVKVPDEWPTHAVQAYLAKGLKPIEGQAIRMAQTDIKRAMLPSSYRKTLASTSDTRYAVRLSPVRRIRVRGLELARDLLVRPSTPGVLTRFPLLPLLKDRLTEEQVRWLVRECGGNSNARDIRSVAWGERKEPCKVRGVCSYADASWLIQRSVANCVHFTFPVRM